MLISIKYVNFPRPGGKYGSLKTVTGETIMVPPDLLGLFRAGQTVDIPTKQQTWGQGTDQERLVTVATSGPQQGNTGAVQGQQGESGWQRPASTQAPYRPNTGFQPRVVQGGGGGPANDPAKDRNIFVCGVVQQAMSTGKFTASEIAVLTSEANRAFDLIGRARPAPVEPPPGIEPGDPGPELQ